MRSKDVIEGMRTVLVGLQWIQVADDMLCPACRTSAGDHLRACPLVRLLEETKGKDDCPGCFARAGALHARHCPAAGKP